jgi:3',5'-cyclic AMP phosphodiesterase CpdA
MDRKQSLRILAGLPLLGTIETTNAFTPPRRKKQFRFVQITDTHVQPEGNSGKFTRKCLQNIMAMKQKPDMIFHTGDIIMDALKPGKERVAEQWKLWQSIAADIRIPIRYCIGNHDVWGNVDSVNEPLYGKNYVVKELSLPGRYYSFDIKNWHIIFLDSTQLNNEKWYTAFIDEEQMKWLREDLNKQPKDRQILIASHIPLLSVSIFDWAKSQEKVWSVSGALMHSDAHEVQKLFSEYPNIRICISGHLHLLDTIVYDKINYLGCGAVSANWWKSDKFHRTSAGYAIVDLYDDGSFEREYVEFPWSMEP